MIGGKECIHRAGAKSLQVEGDELESKLLEDCGELCGHGWIQRTLQFLSVDFDADDIAMMAHAELTETEGANGVFAALDNVESLARNRASVFDS